MLRGNDPAGRQHVELIPYTHADMWLTEALECDPAVMRDLGGPVSKESIPEIHARRLGYIAKGAWYLVIVPEPSLGPVGTIGLWESQWNGAAIYEMCWMILPAFQGRGFAHRAARQLVERARDERACTAIHAFTALTNAASNAICGKLGFVFREECDLDYAGHAFRGNHWELDLSN